MHAIQKQYRVEAPSQPGTYFEQFGWRVIDTQTDNPDFRTIASGNASSMRRYARSLNAR